MIGFKTRVLEGFLSIYPALRNCRDTREVITEATLMGSQPVTRISKVGRFMETVPVFQHVSGFNNNKSKTTALFYHDNTEITWKPLKIKMKNYILGLTNMRQDVWIIPQKETVLNPVSVPWHELLLYQPPSLNSSTSQLTVHLIQAELQIIRLIQLAVRWSKELPALPIPSERQEKRQWQTQNSNSF